jgi:rfaE bifunctional protein nucleotidyltransferase chain/domain
MISSDKILTQDQIRERVQAAQAAGSTVVTTNGVFDLFSVAHLRLLEQAKLQGDLLVVGVNSDESVRRTKGEKRPILPEDQRVEIVAGCMYADFVCVFDEDDPREFLKAIQPNVHVNSAEYSEDCIEADTLREMGAKLVLVPRHEDVASTSDIIKTVCQRFS